MARRKRIGDNGGPPLDDDRGPDWKGGDPHRFLHWKRAHDAAWKPKSRDIALFRLAKAGTIEQEEALRAADSRDGLALKFRLSEGSSGEHDPYADFSAGAPSITHGF